MKRLITGAVVVPMTARGGEKLYFKASVGIEENRIVLVTDDEARIEEFRSGAGADLQEIDGCGKLLMPGLVNTHTHVAMTLMRNMADDTPLMEWLNERVWPFESRIGEVEIAVGARLGIAEMLLGGTTTMVDMYWHEAAVARVARQMGIRAVLCPCFVDGERMVEFERDFVATMAETQGCDRLSMRVAPHAAYSCSGENIRRAVALAHEYGIGLTVHVSETLDEQRMVRELCGCTPTEYLLALGVFELPTIAAHCVHVNKNDMNILHSHGVAVAHNPQSNMKLASGAAPVARMVAAGLNVTLGTDGASSNNDLDMWDEMRSASMLGKLTAGDPSVLPAYDIVRMATVEGARAIGMEGQLGVVTEGAIADLVMLDMEKPHWYPHHDLIAALVYSAKAGDVDTVIVDGCVVVEGGRLVAGDLAGTMHAAERLFKS